MVLVMIRSFLGVIFFSLTLVFILKPLFDRLVIIFRVRKNLAAAATLMTTAVALVLVFSAEDLILYKLMYFGLSQQSKHSRDIAAILKSKKDELVRDYIEGWASPLGLSSLWKELLDNVS